MIIRNCTNQDAFSVLLVVSLRIIILFFPLSNDSNNDSDSFVFFILCSKVMKKNVNQSAFQIINAINT